MIGSRLRTLNGSDISALLRRTQAQFVVADVGHLLRGIDGQDCFDFWKGEVKCHLAEPDSRIELDKYPGAYCYTASLWESEESSTPIVLLERDHQPKRPLVRSRGLGFRGSVSCEALPFESGGISPKRED